MQYINLHLHTDASHLDGLNDIPRLIKRLKEIGHTTCAITDHGNMHGVLKFYMECINNGIKPILGFEAYIFHDRRLQKKENIEALVEETGDDFMRVESHLVLLAKDFVGYQNLLKLTTIGYTQGFYRRPHIDFNDLKENSEGIICINGHVGTDIAKAFERYSNPVSLIENLLQKNENDEYDIQDLLRLGSELPKIGNLIESLSENITVEKAIELEKQEYANREFARAYELNDKYKELFGEDYYLEVQNHGLNIEAITSPLMIQLAEASGVKLVITNDSHYTWKTDAQAHRVHISNGIKRTLKDFMSGDFEGFATCDEFYIKSDDEMLEVASEYGEAGIKAMEMTLEVADKCNVTIDALVFGGAKYDEEKEKMVGKWKPKDYLFPNFTIPAPYVNIEEYFRNLVDEGLKERYEKGELLGEKLNMFEYHQYRERLKYEIKVILDMGFPTYFLILWDVMRFCREEDIPVGKGRGSGAGSLVLFSLRITDVDPMPYSLIFERFLNPDRISLPDVDLDFCYDRIDEVIEYVKGKYGNEYVSKIGTFGTLGAKAVLKDVARVMEYPFDKINALTRKVTDISTNLKKIFAKYPEFREAYDSDEEFAKIVDISKRLEGLQRHTSQHAAGLVISPFPLIELMPLKGEVLDLTAQWEMHDVEYLGFVKMDFLRLRTLTVIKHTTESIERHTGEDIDIDRIDVNDLETYEEFHKGNSLGIFQFESLGMQALLKANEPSGIEDLTALNALYRPGPLDMKVEDQTNPHFGKTMVDLYTERASGKSPVEYDHPLLEEVLNKTYGIIVYQEQVMNTSVRLAGFTLPESDELRKIVGKKLLDLMPAQHDKFVNGCLSNPKFTEGCGEKNPKELAEFIWNQIETFARYGFNKAHACAYADLAYRSMWLKVHYPVHFMSSVLTSWMGKKIQTMVPYLNECRRMGIKVLPPDINQSSSRFEVSKDGKGIHFGLTGIKGVGAKAVENILEIKANHEIRTMVDFITMTSGAVNKTVIIALVKCGAFDFLGLNRKTLQKMTEDLIALNAKVKAKIAGNKKLKTPRTDIGQFYNVLYDYVPEHQEEYTAAELCEMERELTGFYMKHHPLDDMVNWIRSKTTNSSDEINRGIRIEKQLPSNAILDEDDSFANEAELALRYDDEDDDDDMYQPLPIGQTIITGGVIKSLKEIVIKNGKSKGKTMVSFILEDAYQGDIKCTAFAETYLKYRLSIREGNIVFIQGKLDYYMGNAQVNVNGISQMNRDLANVFNNNKEAEDILAELAEIQECIELIEEAVALLGDDYDMISGMCEELLELYERKDRLEIKQKEVAVA